MGVQVVETAAAPMRTRPGKVNGWAIGGLVGLVVLAYARTLGYGLYLDDYGLLRPWTRSQVLRTFHDQFDPSGFNPAYFRPFASLSFAVDWAVWGDWVRGYHITNLVLHVAVVVGVYVLLVRLGLAVWAAFAGAAYFAVLPSNVATVVYIAERTDAMVALLAIVGLLCVFRFDTRRSGGAIVGLNACLVLGLLSKEIAVALVPMALLLWWYLGSRRADGPAVDQPNGWHGAGAHWAAEARALLDGLRARTRRRGWLLLGGPSALIVAVYMVYRERVLPSEGGLGNRFGETQNPVSSLLGGINSTVKGVPWEVAAWAVYPLVGLAVLAFVTRPRDPRWREVLLGAGFVVAGVLPLTFSGGVEPRLLYVAEIGMAVVVAALAMILVDAVRHARAGTALAVGAVAGTVLVAGAIGATMVKSQDVFAEGSAKKLAADLRVHREMSRDFVLPEHIAAIDARLRAHGLLPD
jgi:hypothetical protein